MLTRVEIFRVHVKKQVYSRGLELATGSSSLPLTVINVVRCVSMKIQVVIRPLLISCCIYVNEHSVPFR